MKHVLINAYAISPDWGSEQGVGWNWMINIARQCEVYVITESEFRDKIDSAILSVPYRDNIHMYYIPVAPRVRKMCWNQGNWLFYLFYRSWQKRALNCAESIIRENRIDVIHQLNMVGFREPGFLWKIKDVPFVWGPVGGMELMPISFLADAPAGERMMSLIKNLINRMQRKWHPRVRRAIYRADALIAATKGCCEYIQTHYGKNAILINETGCSPCCTEHVFIDNGTFDILWVGKFQFRKQLKLALDVIAFLPENIRETVRLHIVGGGSPQENERYAEYAGALGIDGNVKWHGVISNNEVHNLMRRSDLFFFTSIMEATSTVVIEAIGNGLPVLCFDTCGFGAVVDESVGIKVPLTTRKNAVADFASHIEYSVTHPECLKRMSLGCKEKSETLSWSWKAGQTFKIYDKCIALRGKSNNMQ